MHRGAIDNASFGVNRLDVLIVFIPLFARELNRRSVSAVQDGADRVNGALEIAGPRRPGQHVGQRVEVEGPAQLPPRGRKDAAVLLEAAQEAAGETLRA